MDRFFKRKPVVDEQSPSKDTESDADQGSSKKVCSEDDCVENQACRKDLMNQSQKTEAALSEKSSQDQSHSRLRLKTLVDCARFLLRQGWDFGGWDESGTYSDVGNFVQLIKLLSGYNEEIDEHILNNAPGDLLITPQIQKEIVSAAAAETTCVILNELGDECFAIILGECYDVSDQVQIAVALRFVNEKGNVLERFLGIVHDREVTSLSLKAAIESLIFKHRLSLVRIRGQLYDGASEMQNVLSGLKSLILKENPSAFRIPRFDDELQLTLVNVAKEECRIYDFFQEVADLIGAVGSSCKCIDESLKMQIGEVKESSVGEENQCGSYYGKLLHLIGMYSSVVDVLETIADEGAYPERGKANVILERVVTFDFVFILHLMKKVLAVTHGLSQALLRRDITNAVNLVGISKQQLQIMRDSGWEALLEEVSSFSKVHDIEIPNMDEVFVVEGWRRNEPKILNIDQYRERWFYGVLDRQLQELNDLFSESNMELLLSVECLSPANSFVAFDKKKWVRLAQFYPYDFSAVDLIALEGQLETYILDVRRSEDFCQVSGIERLAEKLVETKRDTVYPLVYRLLKLVLVLPVAAATVERASSGMAIMKDILKDRQGDSFTNDCLFTYIERDMLDTVDTELIIQRFQNMKPQ